GQDPSKLVYCGPYTVSEWTKGTRVVLKKNPQYWDASKVKLETVNLPIIQDRNARMKSFDTKELDAAGATGEYKDQYKKLADEKKLQYQYGFTPATSYIFFNTKDKENLFTNRDVRMAFSLAWDKDTFVKNVEKAGAPAYGWVPNRLLIGNDEYRTKVPEELKDIKDDPKQLLTKGLQALGKDTDPSKITVTFLSSGTTQLDKDTFDYLADQWKKNLGIKEVKQDAVTDFAQFQQRVDNEQFQISAMGWIGDYNDPMTFLDMWTSANAAPGGTNSSKYENKDYDALIDQVSKEQDNAKRLDIFKQCEQKLLIDDAVISPMYYQDSNFFSYPYVKDLQLPLFGPIYNLKTAYTQGRQ
ncbi:MAG TPA: peptide ABC transporter substrate-binding protein, partial [Clostridiaceae bacterium]|nr:peptide ABC transporter substrate-binding protein [Clostridiaceae bacterium]